MCHRIACPNDGRPTWWGCGQHIEQALAGVPQAERCTCEHERVPYMPLMQRVKKLDLVSGTCDDSALNLRMSTGTTSPRLMLSGDKKCILALEITLPPSIEWDALPIGVTGEKDSHVLAATVQPSSTLDIPLKLSANGATTIFGPGSGSVRRQWICPSPSDSSPMEDVNAKLDVSTTAKSGFGLGGSIDPTLAVALLVLAWVVYNALFSGQKGKRD